MDYLVLAIVCLALGIILGVRLAYWLILWESGAPDVRASPKSTSKPVVMARNGEKPLWKSTGSVDMKEEVVLITCDDCGAQGTEMHVVELTVDGIEFGMDACCQGCAVRLTHSKLIQVIEGPGAEIIRRAAELPPADPALIGHLG